MEHDIDTLVKRFRQSPMIKEVQFGDISSFNFTRKAFYDSQWNDLTVRARGLFIDTYHNEIVCRGYDKFFNIDERRETERENLRKTLLFPVTAYIKENGFLGMISYNWETGGLRFATKSRLDGKYVELLKEVFYSDPDINRQRVATTLKNLDATLLVEVIDPDNDPHIIEYSKPAIVALDIVINVQSFRHVNPFSLTVLADYMGMDCKKTYYTYDSWDELESDINQWEDEGYRLKGYPIEGFVLEDKSGFMVKVKTGYYKLWKYRRSLIGKVINGKYQMGTDEFGDWLVGTHQQNPLLGTESIISLRKVYRYFNGGD